MKYNIIEVHEDLFLLTLIDVPEENRKIVDEIFNDSCTIAKKVIEDRAVSYYYSVTEIYGKNIEKSMRSVDIYLHNLTNKCAIFD